MARAVERLRMDPALRVELGRRGRAFVEQHYDRERLAARYLDVLREITAR
jgi:glycosyltransferase involved in cell wall biosynthesis